MVQRRAVYNALGPSHHPRWLVSRSMHGQVLDAQRLDPGADLVRAFLSAILEVVDAGWAVGEFSSTAALVRYTRGTEHRMLTMEQAEPGQPGRYPGWSGQCVGCED